MPEKDITTKIAKDLRKDGDVINDYLNKKLQPNVNREERTDVPFWLDALRFYVESGFRAIDVGMRGIQEGWVKPTAKAMEVRTPIMEKVAPVIETASIPAHFVGSGIGYLGEELEKRSKMTQEEWEAYKETGLPVASAEDLKKFLPDGEYYERLQESDTVTQMVLAAPFWFGLAQGGVSALNAIRALKEAAAKGTIPQGMARAGEVILETTGLPVAERGIGFVLTQTVSRVSNAVVNKVILEATKKQLQNLAKAQGVGIPSATMSNLLKAYKTAFERHLYQEIQVWSERRGIQLTAKQIEKLTNLLVKRASPKWASQRMMDGLGAGKITPQMIEPVADMTAKEAVSGLSKMLDDIAEVKPPPVKPPPIKPPPVKPPPIKPPPVKPPVAGEITPKVEAGIPEAPPAVTPIEPPRPSVVGEFPSTESILRYVKTPTKRKEVARLPVIRQVVKLLDPKLLADNPIEQAKILQGKLRDMSDSFQDIALAGVNNIKAKGGKPKTSKGIVIDKSVKPKETAPKLPDGSPDMHIHTITENSPHYDMPDEYMDYFIELRQVSREITSMLEKELAKYDIKLHKMSGESDWVYLRRVVDKVGDIEAYGRGRWKGTQKPRYYETTGAGAEAKKPVTYLDPELELKYQSQAAYNWIIDLRVKEMLTELTTTAKARIPAKYINDLIDKTHQKVAVDKLMGSYRYPSLITRAGRGEVISPQTMAQIRRAFPEMADKLGALITRGAKAGEFTTLKKSFWETADDVRYQYELSRKAYQAAKVGAGPRIDEGWGMYLPGKIFTTQELAGKEVLGRDILHQTEKYFGYNRPGLAKKATGALGDVGAVLRQTKASLDLSVQGIQTLGALGLDTMNLIKFMPRLRKGVPAQPSAYWIKGAFRGWQRLFDHKRAKAWIDLPEIKQVQLEMVQHSAPLSQSEFAEATNILSKIPLLGNLYKWTGAAFTWGRNATQTYLYIGERQRALHGLKDPAEIEKRLDELAEWSNPATGGLSTRAMGVGDTQQAVENILFFSTRLNRSVFGNIAHLTEGNYTGHMARDSIGGLMIAVVAFTTGISLALGQKPRLNPLPESAGGDGAKFLTVKVGEGYIGVGSTYYALARLLVNIHAIMGDNPKDLIKLDMGNPIVRFIRSKFGPPMSLMADFVTGHDYLGELTRDNLASVAKTLGDWGIPIWAGTLIEKDGAHIPTWDEWMRALAEGFGGRTIPETDWDKVRILRQIYAESDYNKKFEDLNRAQLDELMRNHLDLAELEEKQKAHWVEAGDAFNRTSRELSEAATRRRDAGLDRAAEKLLTGEMNKYDYDRERGYIRPYYSGAKAILWEMREGLDPEGVKEFERRYAESAKPEDKAMDAYKEFRAELIEKTELPKDWDVIEAELETFLEGYDSSIRNYILEHKDDWIKDLPPAAREVEEMRADGIEDETWWDNYRESSVLGGDRATFDFDKELDELFKGQGAEPFPPAPPQQGGTLEELEIKW